MIPLEVTAHLRGGVAMPHGGILLDSLVARAVVDRDCLPLATCEEELVPIEIPIARSDCGRVYLASAAHGVPEQRELRWINRRFPIAEAQMLGEAKLRRVNIGASARPRKCARVTFSVL